MQVITTCKKIKLPIVTLSGVMSSLYTLVATLYYDVDDGGEFTCPCKF